MNSIYNIDQLRRSDGTYRTPSPAFIRGALKCGHTAHLQTGLGTVAIRPFTLEAEWLESERGKLRQKIWPNDKPGQNWLVEFYPAGKDRDHRVEYRGNNRELAAEFIWRHLTGEDHYYQAGDELEWYANQKEREATVLAVLGDDILIEYTMPGTTSGRETSALVVCQVYAVDQLRHVRNVTHRKCPQYWLAAIFQQQMDRFWIGAGQREIRPVNINDIYTGEAA